MLQTLAGHCCQSLIHSIRFASFAFIPQTSGTGALFVYILLKPIDDAFSVFSAIHIFAYQSKAPPKYSAPPLDSAAISIHRNYTFLCQFYCHLWDILYYISIRVALRFSAIVGISLFTLKI